ncbi:MAG: energy-coupling factor transporter transmembrane protein EcfT [Firmicutes bacterium]|nr:energy-coupling factor transporter transmembrane protein EcfT [Bacillota bacterium]
MSFSELNPAVYTLYFLAVVTPSMFSGNPVISTISLLFSFLYSLTFRQDGQRYAFYLAFFVVYAAVNPIISHNGKTVLFFANDTPITLESALYGLFAAVMIIAVLLWFSSFSRVMTSDRLLYVTGRLSPKLSLVISMAIRFIPLFGRRRTEARDTARAQGYYLDGNIIDTIRCELHVFSVLVTWSLENGIRTSDSMEARGFGVCRRTSSVRFDFRKSDAATLIFTAALTLPTAAALASGELDFSFYPEISYVALSPISIAAYISNAALAAAPCVCEILWRLKWRYLTSKI